MWYPGWNFCISVFTHLLPPFWLVIFELASAYALRIALAEAEDCAWLFEEAEDCAWLLEEDLDLAWLADAPPPPKGVLTCAETDVCDDFESADADRDDC